MKHPRYPEYRASGVDWLGEVPAHWKVKRLKYLATCNDETLSENTTDDFQIEYVDISSVSLERGIERTEDYEFDEAPSRARRRVQVGDTILSTVRTYLKAIARVETAADNLIVSTGFAVVRPGPGMDPGYLSYFLRSQGFIEQIVSHSVGVSYPAINAAQIMDLPSLIPPIDEQTTIATFLDQEMTRIDALIELSGRSASNGGSQPNTMVGLLMEYRTALIASATAGKIDVRKVA